MLSRPEQVVYFSRHILGTKAIAKETLTKRITDYQNWVESYARNPLNLSGSYSPKLASFLAVLDTPQLAAG